MPRLIDAEVLEQIITEKFKDRYGNTVYQFIRDFFTFVIRQIRKAPTIAAEPVKWIPVTEKLPEPFVSVLVQMPGERPFPTVREGFLSSNGIWHSALYDREPDEVTHWMPMPQPPEDGGADHEN